MPCLCTPLVNNSCPLSDRAPACMLLLWHWHSKWQAFPMCTTATCYLDCREQSHAAAWQACTHLSPHTPPLHPARWRAGNRCISTIAAHPRCSDSAAGPTSCRRWRGCPAGWEGRCHLTGTTGAHLSCIMPCWLHAGRCGGERTQRSRGTQRRGSGAGCAKAFCCSQRSHPRCACFEALRPCPAAGTSTAVGVRCATSSIFTLTMTKRVRQGPGRREGSVLLCRAASHRPVPCHNPP